MTFFAYTIFSPLYVLTSSRRQRQMCIRDRIKTTMRYYLTLVRMAVINKSTNKCWWGCGERRNPFVLLVGMQTGAATMESSMETPQKLKINLPLDPDIPLLGIYWKEPKTLIWKDISTRMFIAALFMIAKIWKQPKCLSVGEWIKKLWYIYTLKF